MDMTLSTRRSNAVPLVVQQHHDDLAVLYGTRAVLVDAPHIRLHQLERTDERINAHLDGLFEAGEDGQRVCAQALAQAEASTVFIATALALRQQHMPAFRQTLALAGAEPALRNGLLAALAWASAADLRGVVKALLDSSEAFEREVGLLACAEHRVNPGAVVTNGMSDARPGIRVAALRVAAACGLRDALDASLELLGDEACGYDAARTALMLGDRGRGLQRLRDIAAAPGPRQGDALRWWLRLAPVDEAHTVIKAGLAASASPALWVRACGQTGNPLYVPWLIQQMAQPAMARLAGEAFTFITGADILPLDLDGELIPSSDAPNDDPDDARVALEGDDDLPCPDPAKAERWWQANGARMQSGQKLFLGQLPTLGHCTSLLRSGFQRQRTAAADVLSLLQPGTPLFNVAAPASRQERLLAQMGA